MKKQTFFKIAHRRRKMFPVFFIQILLITLIPLYSNFNAFAYIEKSLTDDLMVKRAPIGTLSNLLGYTYIWFEGVKVYGRGLTHDFHGNTYFVGNIEIDMFSSSEAFIGKINSSNKIEWIYKWSQNKRDYFTKVIFDNSTNSLFIIGETLNTDISSFSDLLLTCVNISSGEELWNQTYGDTFLSEEGSSIVILNEKIFIAGIETVNFHLYETPNIILYCINKTDGSIFWKKRYVNNYLDFSPTLVINPSTEKLYLCYNRFDQKNGYNEYQFYVQEMFLNGSISWQYNSTSTAYIKIADMQIDLKRNLLVLAGDCYENTKYKFRDAKMITMDFTGQIIKEIQWGKNGFNEYATSISEISSEDFYIAGYGENEIRRNNNNAFLAYFREDHTLGWYRKTDEFFVSAITDISYNAEGKIYTVGNCASEYDFFFRRLLVAITEDSDHDSLSSYWEPLIGTDPEKWDTDGDGYSDAEEYFSSTDPLDPRSFPRRRVFWRNFGFGTAIFVILLFLIIETSSFFMGTRAQQTKEKPSFIFTLLNKLIMKVKQAKKNCKIK